jgi:hypothetical protein
MFVYTPSPRSLAEPKSPGKPRVRKSSLDAQSMVPALSRMNLFHIFSYLLSIILPK